MINNCIQATDSPSVMNQLQQSGQGEERRSDFMHRDCHLMFHIFKGSVSKLRGLIETFMACTL